MADTDHTEPEVQVPTATVPPLPHSHGSLTPATLRCLERQRDGSCHGHGETRRRRDVRQQSKCL